MEDVTGDCKGGVGYDHVQVIRKDFTLPSFFNGQHGPSGKYFCQMADVAWIKMLYEHVCQMPVLAGMPIRSAEIDSSPPAEAPMPTIGKDIAFASVLGYHALRRKRRKNERDRKFQEWLPKALTMLGLRVRPEKRSWPRFRRSRKVISTQTTRGNSPKNK